MITGREQQVLNLIALVKKSSDIAVSLELSVHTINNHRKNMLKKTGCGNTSELVMWGMRNGLIP